MRSRKRRRRSVAIGIPNVHVGNEKCQYKYKRPGFLCNEHAKNHPHDNYGEPLPLVNSPRLGQCSYDGPEATEEPDYSGFYSTDLERFTGIGHSIEDCLYQAKWEMKEHLKLLKDKGLPIPLTNINPKIIIQNEKELMAA